VSRKAKGSLKELVTKVNGNHAFRAKFLSDPVGVLGDYGIVLPKQAQGELRQIIEEYTRKLPQIGELPDLDGHFKTYLI
jgi:hypothetical protein